MFQTQYRPPMNPLGIQGDSSFLERRVPDTCQIESASLAPTVHRVKLVVDAYVLVGHDLASLPIARSSRSPQCRVGS